MHKTNEIKVKHPIKLLTNLSSNFSIIRKCSKMKQSKHYYTLTTGRKCGCIMQTDLKYNEFSQLDNRQPHNNSNNMECFQPTFDSVPDILVTVTNLNDNSHSCAVIYDKVNSHDDSDFRTDDHLANKSNLTHQEQFSKKYYSLRNRMTSNNQENSIEQHNTSLYRYSQSSLSALHLHLNIDGLKQFYQSHSTHVIVCKYPVNLYIRYMGKFKIPSIDSIHMDDLWNSVGWGYLIAVAYRNVKVSNSYDSIALILCQPITFKQIWKGYALLPNTIKNLYISGKADLNSNIIEHHVRQIHKDFNDTMNYSHCILMELRDSNEAIQSRQQNVRLSATLKTFLTKCKANFINSSKRNSLNRRQTINFQRNTVSEYCVCKIESMKSDKNRVIYEQSIEFFSQLDELISNAVAFRFQPESVNRNKVEKYRTSILSQQNLSLKSPHSSSTSSLFIDKSQISLPSLFKHVYSISRDDLNTIRTVYGFQV